MEKYDHPLKALGYWMAAVTAILATGPYGMSAAQRKDLDDQVKAVQKTIRDQEEMINAAEAQLIDGPGEGDVDDDGQDDQTDQKPKGRTRRAAKAKTEPLVAAASPSVEPPVQAETDQKSDQNDDQGQTEPNESGVKEAFQVEDGKVVVNTDLVIDDSSVTTPVTTGIDPATTDQSNADQTV